MGLQDIDPVLVEWGSSKYQRGRRVTIKADLTAHEAAAGIVLLRTTPAEARATIADLKKRAIRGEIAQAPIVALLEAIAGKPRPARNCRRKAAKFTISATPVGARSLLDDLTFFSRGIQHHPKEILQATLYTALNIAAGAAVKKQRDTLEILREGVRRHGPWIYRFAERMRAGNGSSKDSAVLQLLLDHAEHEGYSREIFFSHGNNPRLLQWPIQAFLIEFCAGNSRHRDQHGNRSDWWALIGLASPVELMRREVEQRKQRRKHLAHDAGLKGIYSKLLRSDWRPIIQQQPPITPPAIRRLQRHIENRDRR